MPTVKCIAYLDDNTRCNGHAEVNDTRDWPYTVLCKTHAGILDSDTKGYGKFKTQYKTKKNGDKLNICKDNNRSRIPGKVFFCTDGEIKASDADLSKKDFEYDYCKQEYNRVLESASGGVGGISGIPQSPRTMGSPRPGSPTAGSRNKASKLTSTIDDNTIIEEINKRDLCKIEGSKEGVPIGVIDSDANRKLKKLMKKGEEPESEEESGSESEGEESGSESEGEGRRRYLPPLYGDEGAEIKTKLPAFFRQNKLSNISSLLKTIDTTRNATTALKKLKLVMGIIESDKDKEDKSTFDEKDYTVTKKVVDMAAIKLGKYMYDERRIELVVVFLFDYAERDMFNPMRYYGFSSYDKIRVDAKIILDATPYYLLDPGAGKVDPEIAKPCPISSAFKEILDRIGVVLQETRRAPGPGDKPGPLQTKDICNSDITAPITGNDLKRLIIARNTGLTNEDLKELGGEKYTKESAMAFRQAFCTDPNFNKYKDFLEKAPSGGRDERDAGKPGEGNMKTGTEVYTAITNANKNIKVKFDDKTTTNLLDIGKIKKLQNNNVKIPINIFNEITGYINGLTTNAIISGDDYNGNIGNKLNINNRGSRRRGG